MDQRISMFFVQVIWDKQRHRVTINHSGPIDDWTTIKMFLIQKKSLSLSEIKVDRIIVDERVSWNRTTFMSNTAPETQPKIEKNFAVIFH